MTDKVQVVSEGLTLLLNEYGGRREYGAVRAQQLPPFPTSEDEASASWLVTYQSITGSTCLLDASYDKRNDIFDYDSNETADPNEVLGLFRKEIEGIRSERYVCLRNHAIGAFRGGVLSLEQVLKHFAKLSDNFSPTPEEIELYKGVWAEQVNSKQ